MARGFTSNGTPGPDTVQVQVARRPLSSEEAAWVQRQPVHGKPDLNRLRAELAEAGFEAVELQLSADREFLTFQARVTYRVGTMDDDLLLRRLASIFRRAGFAVGFEELAIVEVDGACLSGHTLTGPLAEICEHGAPRTTGPSR
jgi:hypothetical protein